MKELLLNIRVLLSPWVWMRSGNFCPYWDEMLRQMLKNPTVDALIENHLRLNGYSVDIRGGSWFGSSGGRDAVDQYTTCSRKTSLLLRDLVKSHKKQQRLEPPQFYKDYKKQNSKLVQVLK